MSCFKRAEWRSGLTYQITCRNCGTVMTYMDNVLDFRPWFPDGFVYCSRCRTPLRHSERFAIDGPILTPPPPGSIPTPMGSAPVPGNAPFCSQCGNKFGDGARFCANCGAMRN
ncbi:MAG: zinc ribbon domain-containing protein [Clostridia bacterium]|nr:zinc ribbon domain-containing protein [Clostridia bacterium]